MRILFMRLHILPIIDSEEPLDANALWYKCDHWIFSEIYFNCGKKEQESLSDTISAREAWETLADVYQSSPLSIIFRLTTEFHSIKHIPRQPAPEFINTVLAAATNLRFLGDNIQDRKKKMAALGKLTAGICGFGHCPDQPGHRRQSYDYGRAQSHLSQLTQIVGTLYFINTANWLVERSRFLRCACIFPAKGKAATIPWM